MKTVKRVIKRALRSVGLDIHRFIPAYSADAQLIAAMRHFGVTQVFDVGANAGQFGRQLYDLGFDGTVISFEPLPDAHRRLVRLASQYSNWIVHGPTAIGDRTGTLTFHVAENSVSSSARKVLPSSTDAAPESRQVREQIVPVTTLDAIAGIYEIAPVALLKIDTQGFEEKVLDGATSVLQKFEMVLLELSLVELYDEQLLWGAMIERMRASNFDLWWLQPEFVDSKTGRTLQVNGLFRRRTQGC